MSRRRVRFLVERIVEAGRWLFGDDGQFAEPAVSPELKNAKTPRQTKGRLTWGTQSVAAPEVTRGVKAPRVNVLS